MMSEIGCHPYWLNATNSKVCSKPEEYDRYIERYYEMVAMDEVKLHKEFGCLKPCDYMEYQVLSTNFSQIQNKTLSFEAHK